MKRLFIALDVCCRLFALTLRLRVRLAEPDGAEAEAEDEAPWWKEWIVLGGEG